jgi:uncharacterized membrane protein
MTKFNKIFLSGLFTLLPILATIYILFMGFQIADALLGTVLQAFLPRSFYVPGLGLLLTILLVFIFGFLLNHYVTSSLWKNFEKRLNRVPFIKAIYFPLRDLMNLFSKKDGDQLKMVVLVDIPHMQMRALGVVTRENFDDLPLKDHVQDRVAVYFPLSYGMGGFTLLVQREFITPVDMPMDKAMSLAITGWVKVESKDSH